LFFSSQKSYVDLVLKNHFFLSVLKGSDEMYSSKNHKTNLSTLIIRKNCNNVKAFTVIIVD